MIVELFGPPAAGKTTIAGELAAGLRARGLTVHSALSYRPAEAAAAARPRRLDAVRRLGRPTLETLAAAPRLFGRSPETAMASVLLTLMPPVSTVWSIRLRQYIWRLTRAWNAARRSDDIVIFDQAFVQAVCSLGLLCADRHAGRIATALGLVPRADFLLRVDAPRETLRARLMERERRQGSLERMLELDLSANLRAIEITDRLELLLREQGAPQACVGSADRALDLLLTLVRRRAPATLPA